MSFNGLLINHFKVAQVTAADVWLDPVKTVSEALPCRIMYATRLMKDYKGEEVLSIAKLFIKPADIIFGHEDQLQLDDESYAVNHPIVVIRKPQNSVHVHHAEVWIS